MSTHPASQAVSNRVNRQQFPHTETPACFLAERPDLVTRRIRGLGAYRPRRTTRVEGIFATRWMAENA